MQIPVLVQGYPSAELRYNMNFVHSRNLYYRQQGFQPLVLNFGAQQSYQWEDIPVLTEQEFLKQFGHQSFPVVVSHAPNLRNHLRFLWRHPYLFKQKIFIMHGHEVLFKQAYYPPAYDYLKQKGFLYKLADRFYDHLKVRILRNYLESEAKQHSLHLVFVSNYLYQQFVKCLRPKHSLLEPTTQIIPNGVAEAFIKNRYQPAQIMWGDFVSLRPLDSSTYAIDLIAELAIQHPQLTFAVYGLGDYFLHHPPPDNLTWHAKTLSHAQMLEVLPHYRCALMPTRHDSQGVMNCELATYGMPLLTSDIQVAHEVLGMFEHVYFHPNEQPEAWKLGQILDQIARFNYPLETAATYLPAQTLEQELALIASLAN